MKLIWQWKNLKYDYFFFLFFFLLFFFTTRKSTRKRIFPKVLFSVVSVILFLLYFIFSVTTITLERLNQSEPYFHTRLLSEIAWPCTKMGFCLQFQPIQKKFSHMTFDWSSSSEFENGHQRSNVTPLTGDFCLPENSIIFFLCCHDNSWNAQPIRTKFSHRLLTEIAQPCTKMGIKGQM